MKQSLLGLTLLFLITFPSLAQISFEKGYLLDSGNIRYECFIRNIEWKNNPSEFKYKLTEDGELQTGTLETVKEFGVYGSLKYIKVTVPIDQSTEKLESLTTGRGPKWEEKTVFLKILAEGKMKLYMFENSEMTRFFYSVDDTPITQLIYKRYITYRDNVKNVADNQDYKQQLFLNATCSKTSKSTSISYSQKDLEKYAAQYNSCFDSAPVADQMKEKKRSLSLRVTPGLNTSFTSFVHKGQAGPSSNFEFDNYVSPRFGLEAEFILPYNKSKWSIFIESVYQTLSVFKENQISPFTSVTSSIDYTGIEFSTGIRHYFFLPGNYKIYVNALFVIPAYYSIEHEIYYKTFELNPGYTTSLGLGAGLAYKKFSIEGRYYTTKSLISSNQPIMNYTRQQFIVGYRVF